MHSSIPDIQLESGAVIDGYPALMARIDESRAQGLLRSTHEVSLYYNLHTKEWMGDEVGPDGWVSLDKATVERLVDKYGLAEKAEDHLSRQQEPATDLRSMAQEAVEASENLSSQRSAPQPIKESR